MPKFIPGLELAEGYHRDIVAPILAREYPGLAHAAALMGGGSEVLGLDTETSMDHSWGPRFQLFLGEDCDAALRGQVSDCLARNLPHEYRGFPTSFYQPSAGNKFVTHMVGKTTGPVDHGIIVTTLQEFSKDKLGLDATRPLTEEEWLSLPGHELLVMVSGKVFHDDIGLAEMRAQLEFYPRDIWLFILGCNWWRLRRAEQVVGRIGLLEDELGASVLTGRIVQDLMRLAFTMERQYVPYAKWQGSLFKNLKCASRLGPHLATALSATGWMERDAALVSANELLAKMHNALGATKPVPEKSKLFLGRGYHFIDSGAIAKALFEQVQSKRLSQLFRQRLLGNIDLITDNADMSVSVMSDGRIKRLFEPN